MVLPRPGRIQRIWCWWPRREHLFRAVAQADVVRAMGACALRLRAGGERWPDRRLAQDHLVWTLGRLVQYTTERHSSDFRFRFRVMYIQGAGGCTMRSCGRRWRDQGNNEWVQCRCGLISGGVLAVSLQDPRLSCHRRPGGPLGGQPVSVARQTRMAFKHWVPQYWSPKRARFVGKPAMCLAPCQRGGLRMMTHACGHWSQACVGGGALFSAGPCSCNGAGASICRPLCAGWSYLLQGCGAQ